MRLAMASARRRTFDVEIDLAFAPDGPTPGGVSTTTGELRVVERRSSRKPQARVALTASLGLPDECTAETIRRAGGTVARWLNAHGVRHARADLAALDDAEVDRAASAFCEGLVLGAFAFDKHKSAQQATGAVTVEIVPARRAGLTPTVLRRAARLAEAVNLAREWGHEPPNVVNPVSLAARVTRLARSTGLRCKVLDHRQLARMKANAILQVGAASKTPSRLIVLEYPGAARSRNAKPVVLVGKAITFDTGGYSIKDKNGIVGMKYDKCGGMAVIGAVKAAAAMKLKTPVVGIIAAAENMISGAAYRPNDIVKTMSGKTVEIISTDAEGRMVLADALTYAQKHYKPRAVIDLATLTGGVVVALGSTRAGLFSNDDALANRLFESGERVHERLWRLPLDDEYLDLIKGDDSDLKNSAGRHAHPIIGGIFLKQFVRPKTPWAHLDIAGVGDTEKDLPYCPKGATGFGVRLLIDYLAGI